MGFMRTITDMNLNIRGDRKEAMKIDMKIN